MIGTTCGSASDCLHGISASLDMSARCLLLLDIKTKEALTTSTSFRASNLGAYADESVSTCHVFNVFLQVSSNGHINGMALEFIVSNSVMNPVSYLMHTT